MDRLALKKMLTLCSLQRTPKETQLLTWWLLQGTLKCLRYIHNIDSKYGRLGDCITMCVHNKLILLQGSNWIIPCYLQLAFREPDQLFLQTCTCNIIWQMLHQNTAMNSFFRCCISPSSTTLFLDTLEWEVCRGYYLQSKLEKQNSTSTGSWERTCQVRIIILCNICRCIQCIQISVYLKCINVI